MAIKPWQSPGEEKVSTEYSLRKGNNNITCLPQSPGGVSNVTFEYLSGLCTEHNVRVSNCTTYMNSVGQLRGFFSRKGLKVNTLCFLSPLLEIA